MSPLSVVPLDPDEDLYSCLLSSIEDCSIHELLLQRGTKAPRP
ncbi:unnamed protein product [Acidithrix sp. C25]|nr:unnamed protein product [Acidithrix sp. C25]